jgi:hypothetical protein
MEIHGPGTVPLKVIALYKIPPGLSGLSGDIWTTMSRALTILYSNCKTVTANFQEPNPGGIPIDIGHAKFT